MRPTRLPQVSAWHMVMADPRKVAKLQFARHHFSLLLLYSVLALTLASQVALAAHDRVIQTVKEQARTQALATFEATYRKRLLENKDELNRACTSWWFEFSHQERKLDIPQLKKGKK